MKKKKLGLVVVLLITFFSFLLLKAQKTWALTVECGNVFQVPPGNEGDCNCSNMDTAGTSMGGGIIVCCGWYYDGDCHDAPDDVDDTYELCSQLSGQGEAFKRCIECMGDEEDEEDEEDGEGGIWTAVGCIPHNRDGIVSTFIQIGIIMAGGVVLIMILIGSFMLTTSQGDPKKTQDAKELITSAIIGLLFIIFSVTILQFIGVSILKIPGFGG